MTSIEKKFGSTFKSIDKSATRIFTDIMKAKDLLDSAQARTDEISNFLNSLGEDLQQTYREAKPQDRRHDNGRDRSRPKAVAVTRTGSSGLLRMLAALVQHTELTRTALAHLSVMSPKSGTFSNYLSAGRTNGWWESAGEVIRITDEGVASAGDVDPLPSGDDLLDYWCSQVTGAARDMLRIIAESGVHGIDRDELARAVNMSAKSGTFSNYLSKLRSLQLISRSQPFVAVEELRS